MLHPKRSLSLTKPGRNFRETKWRIFFRKSTSVTRISKYQWRNNVLSYSLSTLIVGLYKFGRVLIRFKVALAIFQQVMHTTVSDLHFAVEYLDDILMKSQNVEQHKEPVHKVFSRNQEYGFKLKESKCNFSMEKIKYLGHIIHTDDRIPNPERITAS